MIKLLTTVLCVTKIGHSAPYQYNNGYSVAMSSLNPTYAASKQDRNADPATRFNVGYKVHDSGSMVKMKNEYANNGDYQAQYSSPDTSKRSPPYNGEFVSYDDAYSSSTPTAPIQLFPYTGQLKFAPPAATATVYVQPPSPVAVNKLFVHPEEKAVHHLVPEAVGHYIADIAGHKLKHVGEALESGALNEPIIHKLSFAKAALLQLLAILGPLSAVKTLHVVAKASDPHHHDEPPAPAEPLPILPAAPFLAETYPPPPPPPSHPHYPPTLTGMILHFVSQLSKFNTEAKLHLIPNLLKIVSYASSSSAHKASHH